MACPPSPTRSACSKSRRNARLPVNGSGSLAAGPSSNLRNAGCRHSTKSTTRPALRACGYTKDTPNPPGGEIQHDSKGNPTGLLIARPNATILYATLAKGPKLPLEHQMNSTRHFMRELNRLGLTSIIDAGGGFQNYPEDYAVIEELHKQGEMTLRISYQGEYFMDRYGKKAVERTPPVRKMLELGIPVGAGTDATRVASYNPWVSLYWLVTGKTVSGVSMYSDKNRLNREEALRLYTQGSSWFSNESGNKGSIAPGQLADVVALSDDYFSVREES